MNKLKRGNKHNSLKFVGILGILVLVVAVVSISTGIKKTHAVNKYAAPISSDWTLYQHDLAHNGYNANETVINPNTASNLQPSWIHHAGGTISTQPVIANGLLYWGSWDGYEHATNPSDPNNDVWTANLGMMPYNSKCVPPQVGVGSTATIKSISLNGQNTSVLFVGGGDGNFYALDALTGKVIWSTPLGSIAQGYFLWASPVFYQGSIYMGVSSEGDCPLIRGYVVKLNPVNGAIQNTWYVVPQGCDGGGVWSTITVDQADGKLYFGTGTADPLSCSTPEDYAEAVVELNASDLSFVGAWKIPQSEQVQDGDIGATMNLFTANIGGTMHNLVGVPGKNGIYYAFDRNNVSAGPLWRSQQIATTGDTLASPAWDGTYLYVAGHSTTYNGMNCEDSIRAIDPSTGNFVWTTCVGGGLANCNVIAVPGLVVAGIGYRLFVLSTITTATTTPGQVLFSYQEAQRGNDFYSVSILNGVLYAGNVDGNLYAFTTNYNNIGISDDGSSNVSKANFDGGGYNYSAQALQAAGLTPGVSVGYNGITFVWPDVPLDVTDNYQANGQTVQVTPVNGATTLAFLGSAVNGPSVGTATITYTDGSTQTFQLGFSDWTLNGNTASPSYGNAIVATTTYRNNRNGGPDSVKTHVLYASTALQSGKTVQSVTLPTSTNAGQLHVFAIGTK